LRKKAWQKQKDADSRHLGRSNVHAERSNVVLNEVKHLQDSSLRSQ
jgi:hypothetical protein